MAVIAYTEEGELFTHGSGFIIRGNGAVVTSLHVVSNAADLKVRYGEYLLDVEGLLYEDSENDIVIIKAAGEDLQTVRFGDSDTVAVNDTAYVMSSPGGRVNVISEGIVSSVGETGYRKKMLRMSAPFSAGSSGGPVFNDTGEVIGIATFKVNDIQALHFAMPVNLIKNKIPHEKKPGTLPGYFQGSSEYWLNRADRMRDSGRYEDAVEAYQKALEKEHGLARAHNGLGNAYLQKKNMRKRLSPSGNH